MRHVSSKHSAPIILLLRMSVIRKMNYYAVGSMLAPYEKIHIFYIMSVMSDTSIHLRLRNPSNASIHRQLTRFSPEFHLIQATKQSFHQAKRSVNLQNSSKPQNLRYLSNPQSPQIDNHPINKIPKLGSFLQSTPPSLHHGGRTSTPDPRNRD